MKTKRFTAYHAPGGSIQLRDSKITHEGFPNAGIVAVFPTLGAGFSTSQLPDQAIRLARKVARILNSAQK